MDNTASMWKYAILKKKKKKQRKGGEAGKVGPRHERGSSTDWRELLISGERWEGLLMEEAWLQLSPEGQKWSRWMPGKGRRWHHALC